MKLKPCPFCGGERLDIRQKVGVLVECLSCGCGGPIAFHAIAGSLKQETESAKKLWNERKSDG